MPLAGLFLILLAYHLLIELLQCSQKKLMYFLDLSNIRDLLSIGTGVFIAYVVLTDQIINIDTAIETDESAPLSKKEVPREINLRPAREPKRATQ